MQLMTRNSRQRKSYALVLCREKIKQEAVSISKTLGFGVLKEFCDADARLHGGLQTHNKVDKAQCDVDHDCYTWISSELQQINALQAKLDASNDEDEKRALEEDTTGKILWLCWRGLRQEVGQVPEKVIDRIARDQRVCYQVAKARGQALHEIIEIFQEALAEPVEDDQAHLRRIMADAEAGTSKYDLLHSVPFFKVIRN
ncbi:hypothetical protein EDC04DRAFT_992266 [Pisolithus marmoratus]|nr:hypothetical protein EDC04DRAFT_992266 [Pisolithus marmoratus]